MGGCQLPFSLMTGVYTRMALTQNPREESSKRVRLRLFVLARFILHPLSRQDAVPSSPHIRAAVMIYAHGLLTAMAVPLNMHILYARSRLPSSTPRPFTRVEFGCQRRRNRRRVVYRLADQVTFFFLCLRLFCGNCDGARPRSCCAGRIARTPR